MEFLNWPQHKKSLWGILAFCLLGIGFYLLYQYSLYLDDDYLFTFFTGTDHPIKSIKEALQSQMLAYMTWNGRFVIHTVVHLFCGIWGMKLFSVLNTFMFLVFFWFIIKLTIYGKRFAFLKGFLLVPILWFFIPILGVTFLGNIAFSVNYLWASVAILGFLLVFEKCTTKRVSFFKSMMLIVFGLFIGSLQESFSVGVGGSLFIYYCSHFKELKGSRLYLVLGFWLGTLIIVGAPGNFYRMEGEQATMMDSGLKMFVLIKWSQFKNMFFGIPILNILLVVLVLMFIRNRTYALQYVKNNQIYLSAIVINLGFALVIAYKGQWQITSSVLFAIIMLVKLVFEKWEEQIHRYRVILISVAGVLMIVTYLSAWSIRRELYKEHSALVQVAKTTKNTVIWSDYEVMGRMYQQRYRFMENYFRVVFYMGDKYHKRLLSCYLTKGKNPNLVTCVLPFSPEKTSSFCTVENQLNTSIQLFKAASYPFFIIQASSKAKLLYNLDKLNELDEGGLHMFSLNGLGCESFQYNGKYYTVIFHK
jgi:hypothetical protein